MKIENPAKHSPNTIDCASCHMAAPFASELAKAPYLLTRVGNPNTFVADPRFIAPGELEQTIDSTSGNKLHAFSYVGRGPGINQRTVNETAEIVRYLNTLP